MGGAPNTLTSTQTDAIGYLGGGILAICLIPQVCTSCPAAGGPPRLQKQPATLAAPTCITLLTENHV
jgi:hypothetical protein